MAFQKKTWKDRVSEQPQRRLITPVGGGTSTTVDVTRQEGIVIQEGDAFSAANMNDLENRIKTTLDADEASIQTINTRSSTNANNIASLQSNVNTINNSITNLNNNKAPTNHAVNAETYGLGTQAQFGHVKLSDSYTALNNKADYGLGASGKAVADAYSNLRIHDNIIENRLFASQANAPFYFDWQNGKYGFNTDANRGADTFHPFNRSFSVAYTHPGIPDNCVPTFLGYSNGVLQLGMRISGDQTSIGDALEEYVVTNCKHIVFDYQEVHGDGRGSLYIDGTLVASNTSYSGDLDPNVTHTIQVRALDYHHQFARGYTFTFDV